MEGKIDSLQLYFAVLGFLYHVGGSKQFEVTVMTAVELVDRLFRYIPEGKSDIVQYEPTRRFKIGNSPHLFA